MKGIATGVEPSAWESLWRTRVFLKAPITTPQGGGYKSLNVTTRKTLGLYANIRPCVAYAPFVETKHPNMNVVIVRENEEDTYAGIEHRQTADVYQCLKLISPPVAKRSCTTPSSTPGATTAIEARHDQQPRHRCLARRLLGDLLQ